jgi:hypothetical protein
MMGIPPSFHHESHNAAETISDFLEKFDPNTDGAKAFVHKVTPPHLKKAGTTLLQILVPKQKWREHVAIGNLSPRMRFYSDQTQGCSGAEYCVASKRDLALAGLSMAERAGGTFWPTTGVPPDVPLRKPDRQKADYEYVRDAILEYNSKSGRGPLQVPTRDLVTNWDESSHSRFRLEMNDGKDSIVFFTGRGCQVVKADQLEAFDRRSRGSDRSR